MIMIIQSQLTTSFLLPSLFVSRCLPFSEGTVQRAEPSPSTASASAASSLFDAALLDSAAQGIGGGSECIVSPAGENALHLLCRAMPMARDGSVRKRFDSETGFSLLIDDDDEKGGEGGGGGRGPRSVRSVVLALTELLLARAPQLCNLHNGRGAITMRSPCDHHATCDHSDHGDYNVI